MNSLVKETEQGDKIGRVGTRKLELLMLDSLVDRTEFSTDNIEVQIEEDN